MWLKERRQNSIQNASDSTRECYQIKETVCIDVTLKGLCHEMIISLSVNALIAIFSLTDEQIKLKF
jgi:hypothetical protein